MFAKKQENVQISKELTIKKRINQNKRNQKKQKIKKWKKLLQKYKLSGIIKYVQKIQKSLKFKVFLKTEEKL